MAKYWTSPVGERDDSGALIDDVVIDGKTKNGHWALMSEASFEKIGLGISWGLGQKYEKQKDGKWLLTEGGRR